MYWKGGFLCIIVNKLYQNLMKKYLLLFGVLSQLCFLQAQDSLNMRLLYHWEDPTIPPAFFIQNLYNEVWGWYDPATEREYAIIGSSIGTHFFDVTDPAQASQVDFVPGVGNMIHRDFKNKDQFLFIVSDEHAGNVQVVDMSYLPDSVHLVYESDTLFQRAHNIWVDGDHLYACIPRYGNPTTLVGGLAMYDIADPANPTLIQTYNQYNNIHDIYTRNDTAYLHSEQRGMYIVDFTDPANPQTLASLESYPFQGYNHSGWLSESGETYVFIDETHGTPVKLLNVSDFSNLTLTNYLLPGMDITNVPGNSIGHNPLVLGDYVFVSYYYDGVRVFDISDQQLPTEIGYYDTYPEANVASYHGNWGVYPFLPSGHILASDMQHGLFVLEFAPFVSSGIAKPALGGVSVYPNPASDFLALRFQQTQRDPALTLFDLMGRKVAAVQQLGAYEQLNWTLPDGLTPGIYLLQVETASGLVTKKITIE